MRLWCLTSFVCLSLAWTARAETLYGQEYVPLDSVASAYGLGAVKEDGKEFTASGGGHSVALLAGSRQCLIDGIRHWLSFPAVARGDSVILAKLDVSRILAPAFNPDAVKGLRPVNVVVLDAGHGGYDHGASSSYGFEKDFALDVARRVRKNLEKAGVDVVMTRDSDVFIPLESRPARARKLNNSIFVSIHFNSGDENRAANGLEIFCIPPLGAPPTGQTPGARDRIREPGHALESNDIVLAETLYNTISGQMTSSFDRGVKRARFAVLREATVPAVLIEGGFLTNSAESARIASAAWRDAYAQAIASGILAYKRLAEQGVKPRTSTELGRPPSRDFVPEN